MVAAETGAHALANFTVSDHLRIGVAASSVEDAERGGVDLDDDDDGAIAAVTVAELLVGVKLAAGRQRNARQAYVDEIIESVPIIAHDRDVAVNTPISSSRFAIRTVHVAHDLLIAATARATDRTVVTANLAAFANLPRQQPQGSIQLAHDVEISGRRRRRSVNARSLPTSRRRPLPKSTE